MEETVAQPHIHYGQEEVAELEWASLKVQHIFDKTQMLMECYFPESIWKALLGMNGYLTEAASWKEEAESGIFQKWIKSPKGWKCIGCERYVQFSETHIQAEESTVAMDERLAFHDKGLLGRILQMIIWSKFEKIRLFHPFLGDDPFFTEEEMEIISCYFVPTYLSPVPLKERGKDFKTLEMAIPLYQERISAPALVLKTEGINVAGNWMTGVDLSCQGFSGLRPYLKVPKGGRTYMKALIT
ncbi:hypothetical protein [Paenibacillus faecalis]|uniref:hypothetical protein n=1 Tax=Paenibacillus faecalis TaxID=2079532 RepID=UPI000D0E4933|nr:hypothetical protein [Paenibacillus faecalis]